MRKVVLNTCYGGFSLSDKAKMALYKRKHPEFNGDFFYYVLGDDLNYHKLPKKDGRIDLILTKDLGDTINLMHTVIDCNLLDEYNDRHDKDLVAIVEELGKESYGPYSRLEIVEINDDDRYIIDEYDGWESIILESQIKDWDWK